MKRTRRAVSGLLGLCAVLAGLGMTAFLRADPVPTHRMLVVIGHAVNAQSHPFFMAEWNRLIAHKAARGIAVDLVYHQTIRDTAPGRDDAEKFKNYFRTWKEANWATARYAVIGEDFDQAGVEKMPVRYTANVRDIVDGLPDYTPATLQYYGDLYNEDGTPATWDDNAYTDAVPDLQFAKVGVDRFSLVMNPEEGDLFVGYLPVQLRGKADSDANAKPLRALVSKIIGYEDASWDPPGSALPGRATPALTAGNWFMNWGLFGGNVGGGGPDDADGCRDRHFLAGGNQDLAQQPADLGLHLHGDLVGDHFEQGFAFGHGLPLGDQPGADSALFHGEAQLGHDHFCCHTAFLWNNPSPAVHLFFLRCGPLAPSV